MLPSRTQVLQLQLEVEAFLALVDADAVLAQIPWPGPYTARLRAWIATLHRNDNSLPALRLGSRLDLAVVELSRAGVGPEHVVGEALVALERASDALLHVAFVQETGAPPDGFVP